MTIHFSESLSYRFANQALLVSIAASLLVTVLLIGADYKLSQDRIFEDTGALLQSGSQTSRLAVFNLDPQMTQTIVDGLIDYPSIVYAVIIDNNGKILARSRRSPQLSRYRWISDSLIGNNVSLQQALIAPKTQALLGYLLIEIDTFILGKRFLERASLLFVGGMTLAGLITVLLILLHRRHLTQPLQSMIQRLDEIDPKAPEDERLAHPLRHDTDEVGILVEQINKLLLSISSHASRRERAESDLRKNLSSVEFIVTERTEALRSTSQRLQAQLHTYQKDIEKYQQSQHVSQQQQQQQQARHLLRLQLLQAPLKHLAHGHIHLFQPSLWHQSLTDQLKLSCQQMQNSLLPAVTTSLSWVTDDLELMIRNLALYLRDQLIELHCSFENPLACVWQVERMALLWLSEQITLCVAEQAQLIDATDSCISHELHLRGRLNLKHHPTTPHLQITWYFSNSNTSLQPLMQTLLDDPDAEHEYLRQTLSRNGATLRLSTKHSDRLRLLLPLQPIEGPHLNDWSASLVRKKILLVWCEQPEALRHLQNTLRGLHLTFDTLSIESHTQLGANIESLTRTGYLGCFTNHTALAQRLRQQSILRIAELKPLADTCDHTHLSYPLRQQECLQLLSDWTRPIQHLTPNTWIIVENHPIHQAMLRTQFARHGQTIYFAHDKSDIIDLLHSHTIHHILINPICLPEADEFIDQLYQSPSTTNIAVYWLGQAPEASHESSLCVPFTSETLAAFLANLS
jgi:CheY-like chemotaxis protein